jgi:hypothetical protein
MSDNVSVIFSGTAKVPERDEQNGPAVGFPVYDVFTVSRSGPALGQVVFDLSRIQGKPVESKTLTLQ